MLYCTKLEEFFLHSHSYLLWETFHRHFYDKSPTKQFYNLCSAGFLPVNLCSAGFLPVLSKQNYYVFSVSCFFFANEITGFFIILKSYDIFRISFFVCKKNESIMFIFQIIKAFFSSIILFYIEFRIFASINLICLQNTPHVISAFKRKRFSVRYTSLSPKAAAKLLFSWHFTDIHKISRIIQIVYQIII